VPPTDRGRSKDVLTPLELQIMQVLWEAGAATVADVQARLPGELA
jgi:predicted transcriptional regulator